MKTKLFTVLLIALAMAGCKKDDDESADTHTPSIYVAGAEWNASERWEAKIWKDGELLYTLTDGTKRGGATSIFVVGNDVYAAGVEGESEEDWLEGDRNSPRSIYVAKVWKNGETLYTFTNDTEDFQATYIFISGNDVYVAGYVGRFGVENGYRFAGDCVGKVWKNGELLYTFTNTIVNSIYVSGNDVYVAGCSHDDEWEFPTPLTAKVWKNGTLLYTLTNGNGVGIAFSLFVAGNDVYVAGCDSRTLWESSKSSKGCVWKNGLILHAFETETLSEAHDLQVVGNDVYIAGVGNDVYAGVDPVYNGRPRVLKNDKVLFESTYTWGNRRRVHLHVVDGVVYAAYTLNIPAPPLDCYNRGTLAIDSTTTVKCHTYFDDVYVK